MKQPQRKFTTLRGFIRLLRANERAYGKQAQEQTRHTDQQKWLRGWLEGTANAMGWAADELRRLK